MKTYRRRCNDWTNSCMPERNMCKNTNINKILYIKSIICHRLAKSGLKPAHASVFHTMLKWLFSFLFFFILKTAKLGSSLHVFNNEKNSLGIFIWWYQVSRRFINHPTLLPSKKIIKPAEIQWVRKLTSLLDGKNCKESLAICILPQWRQKGKKINQMTA